MKIGASVIELKYTCMLTQASDLSAGSSRHVAVVGTGIIGVCCARSLQRDGHRVTLIDRTPLGQGASFGNSAVLATESVVPVATPGIWRQVPKMLLDPLGPLSLRWQYLPQLTPWLLRFLAASRPEAVERISLALQALLDDAVPAYRLLLKEADAEDLLVRRGWIAAYTEPSSLRSYRRLADLQSRRGVEVAELSVAEMRQMEPALTKDLAGGLYYPQVAHALDPHRVLLALAERVQREGGKVLRRDVVGFRMAEGRVQAVETTEDSLDCDAVVVAAGAWSKELAKRLGVKVPLDTERGYHLTIPAPGIALSRPVYSTEFGMACTPLASGLRLGGTVELGGTVAAPNWKRAQVLAERGRRLFPDLDTRDASRWMGFRPSLPDSLPVLGTAPRAANAVLAFGHGHLGLTLGARTGRLVADLVAGRPAPIDLAPFAATRF